MADYSLQCCQCGTTFIKQLSNQEWGKYDTTEAVCPGCGQTDPTFEEPQPRTIDEAAAKFGRELPPDWVAGWEAALLEQDEVNHPSHYKKFEKEAVDIIKFVLGEEGFQIYCQGCELKYRLRAGFKTADYEQDMEKAMKYYNFRRSE